MLLNLFVPFILGPITNPKDLQHRQVHRPQTVQIFILLHNQQSPFKDLIIVRCFHLLCIYVRMLITQKVWSVTGRPIVQICIIALQPDHYFYYNWYFGTNRDCDSENGPFKYSQPIHCSEGLFVVCNCLLLCGSARTVEKDWPAKGKKKALLLFDNTKFHRRLQIRKKGNFEWFLNGGCFDMYFIYLFFFIYMYISYRIRIYDLLYRIIDFSKNRIIFVK